MVSLQLLHSVDYAKKFNGLFIAISSVGGILGGLGVSKLALPWGTENLVLVTLFLLIPGAFLSNLSFILARDKSRLRDEKISGSSQASSSTIDDAKDELGLRQIIRNPLLRYIFFFVVFSQVISAALGLRFQEILQIEIPSKDLQTSFSGKFFLWVNGLSLFFQLVLTPLSLRFIKLKFVQLLIPVAQIFSIGAAFLIGDLFFVGLSYLLFKVLDYSLFRGSKELMYMPLKFSARYRAKETIDVLAYRTTKGGVSLLFLILQKTGLFLSSFYSIFALISVCLWAAVALKTKDVFQETSERPSI